MFAREPVAIVDIGSNSVRLVVFSGRTRVPSIIFNEKVSAGLGRGLIASGTLTEESQARALQGLRRFRLLTLQMGAVRTRAVATAAVREASNGPAFIKQVRAIGFEPEIISGEEEGRLAGLGVLSAIPGADGIAGDLGGGSLELVEISGGRAVRRVSLPLGVLRLDSMAAKGPAAFKRAIGAAVDEAGFTDAAEGRPFYLVGGSWRSLAHFDMALSGHPLPISHQHAMLPGRPQQLGRALAGARPETLAALETISSGRRDTLPRANALLEALVPALDPALLIVSAFGIREGLLYDDLDPETRQLDPLLEQAREAGAGLGRFEQHGTLLDRWISPVCNDLPQAARLRHAACLLSDVAWSAHPDFRAERGVDFALHGNWVAIDAGERVMLALALFIHLGGKGGFPVPDVLCLCSEEDVARATRWGLAMALGQRLSGGMAAALEGSALERSGNRLQLKLRRSLEPLAGKLIEGRLKALAANLDLKPELILLD
ncbi:MAG TPA: Ppx/GppA family phosphatase [Allosphingosinicella sp.]|nr:Ppx/GppA family phosphatase [Allosphingosinicella sp.]